MPKRVTFRGNPFGYRSRHLTIEICQISQHIQWCIDLNCTELSQYPLHSRTSYINMTPIQKDQQLQPRTPLIISYLPINLPRNRSFFNNTCSPIRSTIAFTWTTITVITNCWHTSKIRTSTPDDAASFNKIASREIWGFSISPCSFSCLVRPTVKLPLLLCYFTSFSLNFQIMTRFLLIGDRFGIIFEKFNASVILSAKYFVPVFFFSDYPTYTYVIA